MLPSEVAARRTASVAIAPVGSSAWAMPNHPSASAADPRYTIVSHRAVSRASTHASERPSASSR